MAVVWPREPGHPLRDPGTVAGRRRVVEDHLRSYWADTARFAYLARLEADPAAAPEVQEILALYPPADAQLRSPRLDGLPGGSGGPDPVGALVAARAAAAQRLAALRAAWDGELRELADRIARVHLALWAVPPRIYPLVVAYYLEGATMAEAGARCDPPVSERGAYARRQEALDAIAAMWWGAAPVSA